MLRFCSILQISDGGSTDAGTVHASDFNEAVLEIRSAVRRAEIIIGLNPFTGLLDMLLKFYQ